ncbi:MAG: right-handed parallel beta-helix repeat-containing protein [Deltaproteobacteria bacterium]|nr:right-handed parallel beta-helix repeat-containing protein [Deltaproteobacteria bacterium]
MARRGLFCVTLFLAFSASGCDLVPLVPRLVFDGSLYDSETDATAAARPWGVYAASLPVKACLGELSLEVDTTTIELDGGELLDDPAQAGSKLSFPEALTIAANRSERVAIHFDANVFAAETPATIAFTSRCSLPDLENVCIDGRERGVIIDFGTLFSSCTLRLRRDALVVGLELRHLSWQISVDEGAQIAGCRLNTDGRQHTLAKEPETLTATGDALIGPGNSFGGTYGVVFKELGMATIRGNTFGFDPATGALFFNQFGVRIGGLFQLSGTLRIEENVFRSHQGIYIQSGLGKESTVHIINNRFERGGDDTVPSWVGISAAASFGGEIVFGPDNEFSRLNTAISLNLAGSGPTITRNSMRECDEAIVLENAKVTPPTITRATPTFAEGSCQGDGLVELFAASAQETITYAGNTTCEGGTWQYNGALREARATATLTTLEGTSMLSESVAVAP